MTYKQDMKSGFVLFCRMLVVVVVTALTEPEYYAQLQGPHAPHLDAMHTTQPICDGEQNDGLDIAVHIGIPVLAPANGVISSVWNDKTYGCGLSVMLTLEDGSVAGFTWLSDTMVYVGQAVKQGQILAHSGQSGNTTKPLLHYTLFTAGEGKVDPRARPQSAPEDVSKPFTDVGDLERAISMIDASSEPENVKQSARQLVMKRFYEQRALVETKYHDLLKAATDAWYANGKSWKKIPSNLWLSLREADRGRLRSGIDPEMQRGISTIDSN